ncbi:hypothetical protein ACOALZ_17820 [Nocardiopsis algeriensis]|uniref:hypothetical protein n=1 Tax=Nocardiopsis algeriensis TaxID=1478215 RepID=UPI003B43D158
MHFTFEQQLDGGVLERTFTLGDVPGILWTPAPGSAPTPLVLLGHPGGLHGMYPHLVDRARRCAADGFAAAAAELPWSGDRPRPASAGTGRSTRKRPVVARIRPPVDVCEAIVRGWHLGLG